jgi:hypothetical protein
VVVHQGNFPVPGKQLYQECKTVESQEGVINDPDLAIAEGQWAFEACIVRAGVAPKIESIPGLVG